MDQRLTEPAVTDWRGLCAELLSRLEESDDYLLGEEGTVALADRARAALAEPEPEVAGPSDEELLGVAAQTIEPYDEIRLDEYEPENNCAIEVYGSELIAFARAVLARWGRPAPVPAEAEVEKAPAVTEVIAWLRTEAEIDDGFELTQSAAYQRRAADLLEHQAAPPAKAPAPLLAAELAAWLRERATWCAVDDPAHEKYDCAADLLERQAAPVPVPVSERLPGAGDCDAEGRCWWGERGIGDMYDPEWTYTTYKEAQEFCTFGPCSVWLPATALPLPQGEVQP